MKEVTWSFSQEFVPQFHSSCTDLASRIEAVRKTVGGQGLLGTFSEDLAKLKKSLLDATGLLPAYDQRQCESRLQVLESDIESLRSSLAPKARFSFKRNPDKQSPSPAVSAVIVEGPGENTPSPANMPSAGIELSSQSHRYLTLGSFPTTASPFTLTVSDLENCIVNLLPSPQNDQVSPSSSSVSSPEISALHVRGVRNSMLVFPSVKGSVLLHDLTSSIVVVGCHQFRMHDSKMVDVYLSISSDPIIEDSTQIRFAPYPIISSGIQSTKPTDDDTQFLVRDFSHIKAAPSPHWSILSEDKRLSWPQKSPLGAEELDAIFSRTGFGSLHAPESCS